MNISTAKKFIKAHGEVNFSGFRWLSFAKKMASEAGTYEAKWSASYKRENPEFYPFDIEKQTAYDDCVSGSFDITPENKLFMILIIRDYDFRIDITYHIPIITISSEICELIEVRATQKADQICKDQDETIWNARVQKEMKLLLYNII